MKILCSGDLHIGRRSSRLPDDIDTRALSSAECWNSLVELALTEEVDLLALSGDIVDEANRYYEATGPLERGIRRLADAGIQVVAVAGNHDHDVLPRLFRDIDSENATLLGAGGQWERHTIGVEGTPVLHIDGWSFPARLHSDNPLRGYSLGPADGLPVLGLLHADLDQPRSAYAPVRLTDLQRLPPSFWLLGHVHSPGLYGSTILYPGSPQAMDPGESGAHGAWLLEMDAQGRCDARQVPLSTVRYEIVEVDVTGITDELDAHSLVRAGVKSALSAIEEEGCGPLRFLSCRVHLTGRTPLHRALLGNANQIAAAAQIPGQASIEAVIERVRVETRPELDLKGLARVNDAPGILAKLLLALESESLDPEQEALLRSAQRRSHEVSSARSFSTLPDADQSDVTGLLKDQTYLLLDELMAGKERV